MPHYQFEFERFTQHSELSTQDAELLQAAKAIVQSAYAPYSRFCVGAAVLLAHGKIVQGVNIENASYPVGLCAERSALASALSQYPGVAVEAAPSALRVARQLLIERLAVLDVEQRVLRDAAPGAVLIALAVWLSKK